MWEDLWRKLVQLVASQRDQCVKGPADIFAYLEQNYHRLSTAPRPTAGRRCLPRRYGAVLNSRPRTYVAPPTITPATVISNPEDHQLRRVNSDLAAPTTKCATSETTAAHSTAGVPLRKKKGRTGTNAPKAVLTPAAMAAWTGFPPVLTPPISSFVSVRSMASGSRARFSANSSASAFSSPFS